MKKSRIVLFMALILIIATICGLAVGCTDAVKGGGLKPNTPGGSTGDGGSTNPGGGGDDIQIGGGGSTTNVVTLSDKVEIDLFRAFELNSNLSETDVKGRVTVTKLGDNSQIEVVVKRVAPNAPAFKIYPSAGGWELNGTYQINVGEGVTFKDYANAVGIKFTVNSSKVQQIYEKDGVLEFPQGSIVSVVNVIKDEQGVETGGALVLQTNGVQLSKGDVFIVGTKDGKKSAYKVDGEVTVSGATSAFSYTKPQMDEVYTTFKYVGEDQLTQDSDVELADTKAIAQQLESSDLATAAFTIFGAKPTFNVTAALVGNALKVNVIITIPDVVKIDGFGSSNLVLTISDTMAATTDSKIQVQDLLVGYDLTATITNDFDCSVTLSNWASTTEITNVQELINKLHQLAKVSENDELVPPISLFRWTLPIAGGAADISYDAKLVFRFAFSGTFNVSAKASLDYNLRANYLAGRGLEVTSSDLTTKMDSIDVEIKGNVEVKIGLIQELSLNILQGVLGVGVVAEIGNYNRLYGYATSNNLITHPESMAGGVYFVGGFYYDVYLNLSVNLFGIINLANQRVAIASGEIQGYSAGERELIMGIEEKQYATVKLGAFDNDLPAYQYKMFDLVTSSNFNKVIPNSDLTITPTIGAEYVTITPGKITVNEKYRATKFDVTVEVALATDTEKKNVVSTVFSYDGALVLDQANYAYDKANGNGLTMTLTMNNITGTPVVTYKVKKGEKDMIDKIVTSNYVNNSLMFTKRDINKLPAGMNKLTITVAGLSVDAYVNVTGLVGLLDSKTSDGLMYEIYSADQIVDMQKKSSTTDFAGLKFIITENIDMNGITLAPIEKFAGTIIANEGMAISNYNINATLPNGNAAFFLVNTGSISNLAFNGNVNVSGIAANGGDYNIAGVVANNQGSLSNVNFCGTINVSTTATMMYVNYHIGGVVGINAKTGTNLVKCTSNGTVNISVLLDVKDVNFYVGGCTSEIADANTKVNTECTLGKFLFTKVIIAK